jgi:GMP synthase (glutamine-hydrolysing)
MQLHYLQHVAFEGPGTIGDWAAAQSVTVSPVRVFAGEPYPDLASMDMLVVLGGPMGIHDDDACPWLVQEKKFLEKCISAHVPVLGICLGAQLIADVLGARVYPNDEREIGWFEVRLRDAGKATAVFEGLPDVFTAFHWHGDTFDIPGGALWCAESDACAHQAFVYDTHVLALQFHLESTIHSVEALIDQCGEELREAPFIQHPATMRDRRYCDNVRPLMNSILTTMHRLAHEV